MQINSPQNCSVIGMAPAMALSQLPLGSPASSQSGMQLPQLADPLAQALVNIVSRVLEFTFSILNRTAGVAGGGGASDALTGAAKSSPFQPIVDLGSSLLKDLSENGDLMLTKAADWLSGGILKMATKIGGVIGKLF